MHRICSEGNTVTPLTGIHHVTAISGDAQKNVDFYSGVLGLRLVKKTVNFDDPGSYHLYYGDRTGTPGTVITFFIWPGAGHGKTGVGEPVALAFRIPHGALSYWRNRLKVAGYMPEARQIGWSAEILSVADPDGLNVELAESSFAVESPLEVKYWAGSGIPEPYAIQGISSVTLTHTDLDGSRDFFTSGLGFNHLHGNDIRTRYGVGASFVDVIKAREDRHGRTGSGTIHHVAFRVANDGIQAEWQQRILQLGIQVSPVMDRNYFHSIYFREPDGVLFEIATDQPGFAIDETVESLGNTLKLPPWYEQQRPQLESRLPNLVMPEARA
jgi:glyoxalase family protein